MSMTERAGEPLRDDVVEAAIAALSSGCAAPNQDGRRFGTPYSVCVLLRPYFMAISDVPTLSARCPSVIRD
jgi:hypothetical protein